jgi:putative flippase GtrA
VGAPDPDPDAKQVQRWAGYSLPRLVGWCAVGSVLIAIVWFLFGDLVLNSSEDVSNAVAFGVTFFVTITAATLWTRHQARRGRRTRWMGNWGK